MMIMCEGRLRAMQSLPLQDAVWKIKTKHKTKSRTSSNMMRELIVEEQIGSSFNILQSSTVEAETVSYPRQLLDLIYQACLQPHVKHPRKPRFLHVTDTTETGDIQLDLDSIGIRVFFTADEKESSDLKKARNTIEDGSWFRSCHGCGRRGTPDMFTLCHSCNGVIFCDEHCQDVTDHIDWCPHFQEYMKLEQALGQFPFTFAETTTSRHFNVFKLRTFLKEKGIHGLGLWRRECKLSLSWYYDIPYGELQVLGHPYGSEQDTWLLNQPLICLPLKCPEDWSEYYALRGLNLGSPVAALLHYSLSLAWIISYQLPQLYPSVFESMKESLCIHVVGAAKEADLKTTFQECAHLLHPLSLHLCLIGPEISDSMHQHTEVSDNMRCTLFSGLYHEVHHLLPHGDFAISFNAGLGAYSDYRPTVQLILSLKIPYFCTDYCLASYRQSQDSVRKSQTANLSLPVTNPFRSPLRMVYTDMDIPRYSNAVIFSVLPYNQQLQQINECLKDSS